MKKIIIIIGGIVVVLVIVAIVGVLVFPGIIADAFLYPHRQPMVKTPADYGLAYEDVQIQTKDGVTLAAWLIRGTGDNVIIFPVKPSQYLPRA